MLFKVSAAPFHVWAPDIYDGSPINSAVFFALVPKVAIAFVFLKFFIFCFGNQPLYWQHILLFCSLISILVGSLVALKQRKLKRLFAYSSIGHMGFFLLAISSANLEGVQSASMYVVVYFLMSSGTWSIIYCLERYNISKRAITLTDFATILQSNPTLAFSSALLLFSMAGIPPLLGFYSKFCVFLSSIKTSLYLCSTIVILVVFELILFF